MIILSSENDPAGDHRHRHGSAPGERLALLIDGYARPVTVR
jgi:hypothetical protein